MSRKYFTKMSHLIYILMTIFAFFVQAVVKIFLFSQVYFREKANIKIFVLSLKAIKNDGRLRVRNEKKYKWGKAVGKR